LQENERVVDAFRSGLAFDDSWLYVAACIFFLLGFWEHLPFSGGRIYSDIVTVYQNRFCFSGPCGTGLPYVNYFVEYPVITGFFMYSMGMLGHILPLHGNDLIESYYAYSSIFLLIPTFMTISNLIKIMDITGMGQGNRRALVYFVATPSFVFMLLLNWYVIGVFFAVFGLRKFLEGSNNWSGLLFGISAASNLITAVPALGILSFGTTSWRERVRFVSLMGAALLAVYVPVIILNSFPHSYLNAQQVVVQYPFTFPNMNVITDFLRYEQNWYAEGSWMLAFFTNTSPLRHYIFPSLFVMLSALIMYKGFNIQKSAITELDRAKLVVSASSMFMFAFLFSSYVCTPQMNLVLLPFFVLLPGMSKSYPEFIGFEIVNSLVIVWGFSAPLAFIGISLPAVAQFGPIWASPIQFLAVLRSLWIGKLLIADGLFGSPIRLMTDQRATILRPITAGIRRFFWTRQK
jgi:hypothetical protein